MLVQSHKFAVHMQYEDTRAHISNLIKISCFIYVQFYMYSYIYNFYRIVFIIMLIMFINYEQFYLNKMYYFVIAFSIILLIVVKIY